jgi:uncharacterized membrane protein (UPF0127 family)
MTLVTLACLLLAPVCANARTLWPPHEPLDPAKAQSLPLTPLEIQSGGTVHKFQVEVAETDVQQHIGLMHRARLAADHGMLFAYERPMAMQFWMRNTFIPLDMLFMKADGQVAYIVENAQPHDETPVGPRARMSAQLELPAGTVAKFGIKVGDTVRHQFFGNAPAP